MVDKGTTGGGEPSENNIVQGSFVNGATRSLEKEQKAHGVAAAQGVVILS